MKDFYDIYTLMNAQLINADVLKQAIRETFENRNTILNPDSNVFSEDFYMDENRNKMWFAYLRKINAENVYFDKVIIYIKQLIKSVIS